MMFNSGPLRPNPLELDYRYPDRARVVSATAFILRVGMFITGIIKWVLDRFHDRTAFFAVAAFIVVAAMLIAALIGWALA